jgi:hypothetical protein
MEHNNGFNKDARDLKVYACPIGACPLGSTFFDELCFSVTGFDGGQRLG